MEKGRVKWFNDTKGFGFIEHPDGSDVFVHYSSIVQEGYRSLRPGDVVQYSFEKGPKGLHALEVVRIAAGDA